ncbi:MAG TPA: glutamate--tRNA ligase family protein [Terracidiphilus sp.]|nr:glutamate--tRNA ligase family protein [Terracidiphilus sp.]
MVASPFFTTQSNYRGRLAPSPTGYLHVGHARTFFTAYQRARGARGTLVFRMEDLDPDRSRPEYAQAALDDLRWLGIEWQEGPDLGGPCAPYAQSLRGDVYRSAFQQLLRAGFLYPCRCSRKDLAAALAAPHESTSAEPNPAEQNPVEHDPLDDEPIYPGACRPARIDPALYADPAAEIPADVNWRFRVPHSEPIEFTDLNLGPQRFLAGRDFGDFIIMRRDAFPGPPRTGPSPWGGGVPSYQLACVADDAAMRITEVVRGADLLKSTARQILLYRALGLTIPDWFHCALVADAHGQRLAKRHDALSLRTLRERGFSPAQVLQNKMPAEL